MARRHKRWAKKARAKLKELLGGVCKLCKTNRDLEFHCIEQQGDRHHRMDPSARMCFYKKQYMNNNLELLCESCHDEWHSQNPF